MNFYQPNGGFYNPYYNQQMQQPMNYNQPVQQPVQQPMQQPVPTYKSQQSILQGKSVDSIDVVKATDIPFDGSVSYFPLTDNTAIITKQIQIDGTSKITVYKPVEDEKEVKAPTYLTQDDLDKALNNLDNKDIVADIKTIKKQIKGLTDDIEELKEEKE